MKKVKRERKAKKTYRINKQQKSKRHTKKSKPKPRHKPYVQKELFEQIPAAEQEKTSKKMNLWIYVSVIIISILILFLLKCIPGLKTAKKANKSTSVVPAATVIVTQQKVQEKVNIENKESSAIKKQIRITIYFSSNKWEVNDLTANEKEKISFLIGELNKDKTIQGLFVYGYADRAGLRPYNLTVSEKRAGNVAEFLSEKTGIGLDKFVIQGKGEILEGPDGVSNPLFRKVEIIKK